MMKPAYHLLDYLIGITRKELLETFLHLTTLPYNLMFGRYKELFVFLIRFKQFRKLRKKYGAMIADKLLGEVKFRNEVYEITFLMHDKPLFEYFALYLRNEIHEPPLSRKLTDIFEKDENYTFVDIGAHYGFFTLLAGESLKPGSKVISIEPNQDFFRVLNNNIRLNSLESKVSTYNIGLNEKEALADMTGWNKRITHESTAGKVPLYSFDSFCEKEGISPDIVKIDVHGAEGNILRGMGIILEKYISHLFCELHEDMNGYSPESIIRMLENAGLNVYEFTDHRLESGGKIVPISIEFLNNYSDRMIYASRYELL